MTQNRSPVTPTSNLKVFGALWRAARARVRGRTRHQQKLWTNKTGHQTNFIRFIGLVFTVLTALLIHWLWGYMTMNQIEPLIQLDHEKRSGLIVVSERRDQSLRSLAAAEVKADFAVGEPDEHREHLRLENTRDAVAKVLAYDRQRMYGGELDDHYLKIIRHIGLRGSDGFSVVSFESSLQRPTELPETVWLFAGLMLLMWLLMLVCQGEGVDFDIQRRRHPHFEWLMSHPVRPLAAFSAEMLAPLLANPFYAAAPVFWFMIFASIFPFVTAIAASLAAGLAFAIAASCMSKAIEIAAMLRLPVRSRGLLLGLVSFFGFSLMFVPFFIFQSDRLAAGLVHFAASTKLPEPVTGYLRAMFVGSGQTPSALTSVFAALSLASIVFAASLAIAWWATHNGLQANESRPSVTTNIAKRRKKSWIKNPYYKKELTWLRRDKASVLQLIMIPLAMIVPQAFNVTNMHGNDGLSWNLLCGLAIIAGTYFLFTIGPRALASEGGALWMAQTWPRDFELLLKAKARMWFGITTCVVYCVLLSALLIFPEHWWRILLVALGWLIFGWGLALKSICLVTAPSSSGEPEKPPPGRRWAALIGTFAFSAGVFAQSWHIAATGVIFSMITAAAMWQNLQARLPYLFDPWSERLPKPPTVLHSVIAIALMFEVMGIVTSIALAVSAEAVWIARTIAYGLVGIIAWVAMNDFLTVREVPARDIWRWQNAKARLSPWLALAAALLVGFALAGCAYLYLELLRALPATTEMMVQVDELNDKYSSSRLWILILAVGLAPVAEEYFFRGLLFRSLDREMHEGKAIFISSAYFALFHPPISWVPVFFLGVLSAWIFKRSGRLLPSVVLHMAYNFAVVMFVN